jgi:alanyl-tRNA synthetase
VQTLAASARQVGTAQLVVSEVDVPDVKALQALGDSLREQLPGTIAVLGARLSDGKVTMLAVVGDELRERGVRADEVVRLVAAAAGGRGGGKPHMAQAGIPDGERLAGALAQAAELVGPLVGAS